MQRWTVLVSGLVVAPAIGAQDTIRVRSDGPPVWGANVRLVQELAIGQLDGPPVLAFGNACQVAAADVIRDNRLYIRAKGPDGEDRIVVLRLPDA